MIVLLYLSEVVGMMVGEGLISNLIPNNPASSYLYVLVSTSTYLLFLYTALSRYAVTVLRLKTRTCKISNAINPACKGSFCAAFLITAILLGTVFFFSGEWYVAPQKEWTFRLFRASIDYGIGAGIAEELVFRGILLKAIENRSGKFKAIAISSVSFSLLHLLNSASMLSALLTFLYTMALAILLCIIKYKTGNLWAAIGFHATWNFIFLGCIAPDNNASSTAIISYITGSQWLILLPIIICSISCLMLTRNRAIRL